MSPTEVLFTFDPPEITKRNGHVYYYTAEWNHDKISLWNMDYAWIKEYYLTDQEEFFTFKVFMKGKYLFLITHSLFMKYDINVFCIYCRLHLSMAHIVKIS